VSQLEVSLVATDREVWSGAARFVKVITADGELGLLPGHAPLLATLSDGEVIVRTVDGTDVIAAVHGGFLSVDTNEVRILSQTAELAAEIDVARAQAALERAQAGGLDEPAEIEAARRAETRLRVAVHPQVHTTR
jgi:F-type H+-transporting ATPase subunit epsilon